MKPSEALRVHRSAIREIVASHCAGNPRVVGSVLHGTDTESSDLDILIEPSPEMTLFDVGAIIYELERLLGVPVDVLTPTHFLIGALPERSRRRRQSRGSAISSCPFGRGRPLNEDEPAPGASRDRAAP